jgi:hypothetical protein
MASTKVFSFDWTTSGLTVYMIVQRVADSYYLNDADGTFAAAPADPYIEATADSVIPSRYIATEARAAWNDGYYNVAAYSQAGGSPAPATDTLIGSGQIQIAGDVVASSGTGSTLCTDADIKVACNISGTSLDTLISRINYAVTYWIQRYCQRDLFSTSYTEYYSVWDPEVINGNRLRVKHYPIISVTTIYDDVLRAYGPADLVAATDYYIHNDGMQVVLYSDGTHPAWYAGERSIKINYVAGYATIPYDLQEAAILLAKHIYRAIKKDGEEITSINLGGETLNVAWESMPKVAKSVIDSYRRPFGL